MANLPHVALNPALFGALYIGGGAIFGNPVQQVQLLAGANHTTMNFILTLITGVEHAGAQITDEASLQFKCQAIPGFTQ